MSGRAKRVLYPVLALWLLTFGSFLVHLIVLGTSAFPSGGRFLDGKYMIEEHGKTITLTAREYWFSYIHGLILVAVLAVLIVLIVRYYWRGDLRDEYRPSELADDKPRL